MKYYSSKAIREKHAHYNVIFGERSDGKTFDVLKLGFEDFIQSGEVNQLAVIRRWETDFRGQNSARTMYNSLMCDGNGMNQIKIISKGKYDGVEYYSGNYYLTVVDEDGFSRKTDVVIAIAFSLNISEHYKSGSYPHVKTIMFDEFLTRDKYLTDEFVLFQNLLSTIIRKRSDPIQIFMLGNTVNKYSPYFREMGLYRVAKMKQGDIDVYQFGDTDLTVAVEYADSMAKHGGKKSPTDVYFAFDNPRLKMITGGAWEIDLYPHAPAQSIQRKEITFIFFIYFQDTLLQCEVVERNNEAFLYIHQKTTPLQDDSKDLIYCPEFHEGLNYRRKITAKISPIETKISWFFAADKVRYQDNEIGEIVRNYINWCKTSA